MQSEVSVIMPCYNQAQYLSEALDSVLAQTHANWECIIVSDGSPDNVAEIANGYAQKDSRIRFYDTENAGVSAARNFAIAQARGRYVLPLDADDKISPNYIEACLKTIKSSHDIKVAHGTVERFGLSNAIWKLPAYSFEALLFINILPYCGMYRKSDCQKISGYDIQMLDGIEDWEFWINFLKDGAKAIKAESCILYWRKKVESRTTKITQETNSSLQQYIYYKHANLYEPYFSDPIQLYKRYKHLKNNWDWVEKKPFHFFFSRQKNKIKKIL